MRVDLFAALSVPLVIALVLLIVYPLAMALLRTFVPAGGPDLTPLQQVIQDPSFADAFVNTLIVIAVAGTAALFLGSLLAWLNERTDASLGIVSEIAPLVPLLIPPVAMAVGWVFLGQSTAGFLNGYLRAAFGLVGIHISDGPFEIATWPGVLFVYTISLVPFAYIVVSPAFRNLDASLEEASRMSGAGPLRTVLRVSLPAIGPALASAALLIVIIAAAMYSVPAIIGTQARITTLSVYIVDLTQSSSSGLDRSVAAALILVAFVTAAWLVQRAVIQRQRQATISGKGGRSNRIRLGRWRILGQALSVLYLLVVAVLPFLALLIVALQPFWEATVDPRTFSLGALTDFFGADSNVLPREALFTSLKLGAIGATVTMLAALILVTYAHYADRRIAGFIRGVTKVPAAISGLVIAVAILFTFAGPPFELKGTFLILLLAYLVMFMPQASVAAEAARGQVGDDLLEASAMLGGSRLRSSLRILWPLMRPGLAYGWAMIFVLILGDLIAAAILAGPGNQVVGSAIIEIYGGGVYSSLAVLSLVVFVTALVVVGIAITFLARRPGHRGGRDVAGTGPTIAS